jgi:hypothetical protein
VPFDKLRVTWRAKSIRRSPEGRKIALAVIHKKVAFSTASVWASTDSTEKAPGMLVVIRIFAALWFAALGSVPSFAAVPAGQPVDGIRCDQMEGQVLHIHQHLAIFDHGKPVVVPEDVGRPIAGNCFYWLHTHTPDGIIHVESPTMHSYTLGQFFAVWGQPLSRVNVAGAKLRPGEHTTVWVDGNLYPGDPQKIELTSHLDVTIDVGPPAKKPAPFTAWNGQ